MFDWGKLGKVVCIWQDEGEEAIIPYPTQPIHLPANIILASIRDCELWGRLFIRDECGGLRKGEIRIFLGKGGSGCLPG